jgi:hypothetical protein
MSFINPTKLKDITLYDLNAVTARGSEPSRYLKDVRIALTNIADLRPTSNSVLSETALVVASVGEAGPKACRDVYRAAFDLLLDTKYVVRESSLWRFKRPFTNKDVDELLNWTGMSIIDRTHHHSGK